MRESARRDLAGLARANALGGWAFTEWLHGRDGTPGGMPGQSWSAAGFLLAQACLDARVFAGWARAPRDDARAPR